MPADYTNSAVHMFQHFVEHMYLHSAVHMYSDSAKYTYYSAHIMPLHIPDSTAVHLHFLFHNCYISSLSSLLVIILSAINLAISVTDIINSRCFCIYSGFCEYII